MKVWITKVSGIAPDQVKAVTGDGPIERVPDHKSLRRRVFRVIKGGKA